MGTVFWDVHVILFIDCLEKDKIITVEYYPSLLIQFNDAIKEKCPYIAKKKVFFHQDNVLQFQWVKLHKLHFELVNYLYFPDLASSNSFPVSKMSGKLFSSNIEVTDTI